jgi:Ca2+-binding RTX toxin-like protein
VRWEVKLPDGRLAATLAQEVLVNVGESTQCCVSGQQVITGTVNQDPITPTTVKPYCVFAKQGGDFVVTPSKNDLLFGGPGADNLNAGAGQDEVQGGDDDDFITGGSSGGRLVAYGGNGGDSIDASGAASARLVGGPGEDNITGSPGADTIVPGPGVDAVNAGAGNDTVILYHECEIAAGKRLDGGSGTDTLVTPLPVSVLQSLGMTVVGFENVVINTDQRHLSECR